MIDFKKKLGEKQQAKRVDPIEIYDMLDRRSETSALRPAQKAILEKWFNERKDERDNIIKLHTGEGKTLIGLLILLSKLSLKGEPCVYICPNIFLVKQVCDEAEKFGVPYCVVQENGELPHEFESGEKILITHAHKLFNGMSKFGVGNRAIIAGAIVLDDAHTCIDVMKSAFTIKVEVAKNEVLYNKMLQLFESDLLEQGEGSLLDIQNGENEIMLVPYWGWLDKKSEVLRLLSENVEDKQVLFAWHLIKDNIENCACFISGNKFEIAPYYLNISMFATFARANHRVLMSATTQDDSFFIRGFGFDVEALKKPLMNDTKVWSGEKMLLIPSLMHENCDRDLVVTKLVQIKHSHIGVVAIVPSQRLANQYTNQGAVLVNSENIRDEIAKLRRGKCENLIVIVNRYDGIDLPDNSCRILVIDSLPYFENFSDLYEEECRPNSEITNTKHAQKIEQGLGRAVRGEKDYCVILLIGAALEKFIRNKTTNKYFSTQTLKQIEIGLDIAKMANTETQPNVSPFEPVISTMRQCLLRDDDWKEYYVSEMDKITLNVAPIKLYERFLEESQIEHIYWRGEVQKAIDTLQAFIDKYCRDDELERGWYLQQLARYTYGIDKISSNELQKAAFRYNQRLLKPKDGIIYNKVSFVSGTRIARIKQFLSKHSSFEELRLSINDTLDRLDFGVDSKKFESALQEVGEFLGYSSQRPDKEIRMGFDNLWCGVNNHYFLFECKNEVKDNREAINKREVGQMNTHIAWFKKEYGEAVPATYFLITSTKDVTREGTFSEKVRIIRKSKLNELKKNIKNFFVSFSKQVLSDITDDNIQKSIEIYNLVESSFMENYSEAFYQKK